MDSGQAVIVGAVRSAFGRRNGSLKDVHPVDLSADILNGLVTTTGIDPNLIDDVIWGCVTQLGDQSSNVARFSVLAAGWSDEIPGVTINRACGSSQQAFDFAAFGVIAGQYDMVIAGGVENMSRVPLGAAREVGMPYGPRVLKRYDDFSFNQGISAELIAKKWGLSRTILDQFALESHAKAAAAIDAGTFLEQIIPVQTEGGAFAVDEGIRRGGTLESLANLMPAFQADGLITAGNSSQISDGAGAVLVTTPGRAKELGLTPIVRFHSAAVTGDNPMMMLTGPISATKKLLGRAGVRIDEIGVYEVNEAFASVPLAWLAETGADPEKLNPLGGAIAFGHPLGASGVGLLTRMVHHMRSRGIRYGLQTMCEGGGTANATLVELVS
jgi:acetyl-CoA acyltransferase